MSQYAALSEMFTQYIGKSVRDRVTNVSGIVAQVSQRFNGNIVLGIQPPTEDGTKAPDGNDVDSQTCEILEAGNDLSHLATLPTPESLLLPIGGRVKDKVTDIPYTITSTTMFMNGCVYHLCVSKQRKDGSVGVEFLPYQRLESLNVAAVEVPNPTTTKAAPGGPTTKSRHAS